MPVAAGEHAGVVALKAARGLRVDFAYVGDAPATGDATSGAFALLAMAGLVVAGTAVKVRK